VEVLHAVGELHRIENCDVLDRVLLRERLFNLVGTTPSIEFLFGQFAPVHRNILHNHAVTVAADYRADAAHDVLGRVHI